MISLINICIAFFTSSKSSLFTTSQWGKHSRCNYPRLQVYKSVKSPTQGHLAINRFRKDPKLQMPSPGTFIITHFVQTVTWSPNQCLSPSVWNTQVLGWWHTKYRGVSEGSWSYQCLWRVGNVCHGWGEGSVNMHSMPALGPYSPFGPQSLLAPNPINLISWSLPGPYFPGLNHP